MCLNKTQPVSDFHSEISGSRPRNSRSLSLWNGIAECRLYLYSIMASNCLEKGSELLFGHCALISSEWKLPKGGSHYQKRQSAKNSFDVGIVLHYYLKYSCCKPCPQCNMNYIPAVFSVFSTSVCPCYCRVHGRCSAGKKLIVFEDPWTLRSVLICLPSEQLLQRQWYHIMRIKSLKTPCSKKRSKRLPAMEQEFLPCLRSVALRTESMCLLL